MKQVQKLKQPATVEAKISKFQHNLNTYMSFYAFYSLNHYVLCHVKVNFVFHLFSSV